MKLNIAQCRSVKKTAAPRGLRRSARISSSSSSSSSSQQLNVTDCYAGSQLFTFLPLSAFSSPCKARKPRTFKKREVSRHSPLEIEVFQPNQLAQEKVENLPDTQIYSKESNEVEDVTATTHLAKQRSLSRDNLLLTKQRSFKHENAGLLKQRSFTLNTSVEAGISRQTSLKIEALIEPRILSRTNSCTTIGRKRVVGVDDLSEELEFPDCNSPSSSSCISEHGFSPRKKFASPRTPSTCLDRSPFASTTVSELDFWQNGGFASPLTPSTPTSSTPTSQFNLGLASPNGECGGDSLLEDLPFDLLVRIVCSLEHDDLKPVSLVCKRMLRAVSIAQRCHFSYTTPHRIRKGKNAQIYMTCDEAMASQGSLAGTFIRPPTPNAPRHSTRPADLRFSDACPFVSGLSQLESPVALAEHATKSLRAGMILHRVLFDEDELCEAVAQNSL